MLQRRSAATPTPYSLQVERILASTLSKKKIYTYIYNISIIDAPLDQSLKLSLNVVNKYEILCVDWLGIRNAQMSRWVGGPEEPMPIAVRPVRVPRLALPASIFLHKSSGIVLVPVDEKENQSKNTDFLP